MTPHILYQDRDLMVINKPPGVVVNEADTQPHQTIQAWFQTFLATEYQQSLTTIDWDSAVPGWQTCIPDDFDDSFGTPSQVFVERGGIVHRLDKDTSGLLLLAKHPGSLVHLLKQFKERSVHKTYLCLVHGKFGIEKDIISFPLGRASRDRTVFAVRPDGREAVTEYEVQAFYERLPATVWEAPGAAASGVAIKELLRRAKIYQGFSLVRCFPHTGRTHQIRVHMAHLQHPLVGDTTYLGRKREALDPLWCPRHFLHAEAITFTHPATQAEQHFTAPLTADLEQVLALFQV